MELRPVVHKVQYPLVAIVRQMSHVNEINLKEEQVHVYMCCTYNNYTVHVHVQVEPLKRIPRRDYCIATICTAVPVAIQDKCQDQVVLLLPSLGTRLRCYDAGQIIHGYMLDHQ